MAGLMQSIFVPRKAPQQAKITLPTAPTEAAAAEAAAADTTKSRQGRGLSSTNLSGMRSMIGSYQKPTLGAG